MLKAQIDHQKKMLGNKTDSIAILPLTRQQDCSKAEGKAVLASTFPRISIIVRYPLQNMKEHQSFLVT